MKTFDIKIFADRVKELCLLKEVSQYSMALEMKISHGTVSFWENALSKPTANSILKLTQYFGVTSDYLFGLED